MDLNKTDFGERAFGRSSKVAVTVKYESQQRALDFIWSTLGSGNAIGVIEGPEGSGKSTVLSQFVSEVTRDTSIAALDGARYKPRGFVAEILARYGYATDLQTTGELLKLLSMFAGQQARSYQPPVIMIDNADRMYPSTLQTLGRIAALREGGKPAVRIILTTRRRLNALSEEDGKLGAQRPLEVWRLEPMTANEALVRKTITVNCALQTAEKALEITGGPGYLRGLGLERLLRDAHAGQFHPLAEKKQQMFSGRLALGLDPIEA